MSEAINPIRVLVVAEDSLARAGLASLLDQRPETRVVGQVPPGEGLTSDLEVYQPDVVVWDLGWGPQPPTDRIGAIGEGGWTVVILAPGGSRVPYGLAARPGGLLDREMPVEDLVAALQVAARGLMVVDPQLAPDLAREPGPEEAQPLEPLTAREIEVLGLVAEGLSNKAIAARLSISEFTVKFHVNAVLQKLGAQSRTEAAIRAARLGLIPL